MGKKIPLQKIGLDSEKVSMKYCKFDLSATNACKGFALILLLWHHLFTENPEYGYFIHLIAGLSKVCVATFVILSGYGLAESVKNKKIDLLYFYQKRLSILYSNYWFVAFLFVSIGIIFFNRTFDTAFINHGYIKFAIQMTGLHRYIYSEYGYNATWWFMSLIIPLYILFPFLYDLTKKYNIWFLLLCFVTVFPSKLNLGLIQVWILPFVMGIFLSVFNEGC